MGFPVLIGIVLATRTRVRGRDPNWNMVLHEKPEIKERDEAIGAD